MYGQAMQNIALIIPQLMTTPTSQPRICAVRAGAAALHRSPTMTPRVLHLVSATVAPGTLGMVVVTRTGRAGTTMLIARRIASTGSLPKTFVISVDLVPWYRHPRPRQHPSHRVPAVLLGNRGRMTPPNRSWRCPPPHLTPPDMVLELSN